MSDHLRKTKDRLYVSINSAGHVEMITAEENRRQMARLEINPAVVAAPWGTTEPESRGRLKLPNDFRRYLQLLSSEK